MWDAYGATVAVLLGSWISARQAFVSAKKQIAQQIELAGAIRAVTTRNGEDAHESET